MSEKQKTLVSLTALLETSKAALAFLADPTQVSNPSLNTSDLSLLHKDFLSLLSLIYVSTTKLSLVLKPSSPSYTAALEPLKELLDRVAALPHCVRLLQTDHGRTLAAEADGVARDVLDSIKALVEIFIAIELGGSPSAGRSGGEYLVKTGTIHNIVDAARGRNGFSANNFIAMAKIWKSNQESLDDGMNEVQGMLEAAKNSNEDGVGNDEEFDDGWAELEGTSNVKPSLVEQERITKIYAIVRLSTLLHKRILDDVLSSLSAPTTLSSATNSTLDDIADASSGLLVVSDNFISTMYPPQVPEHICVELQEYQRQLTHLQTKVDPLIPEASIEEQLQKIQLSRGAKSTDRLAKLRKWYIACINQINKNIQELEHELRGPGAPSTGHLV